MHPAEHHVRATKKRQKDWVEGRARGGRLDRPGRKGLVGGASEEPDGQSNSEPLEARQRLGIPLLSAPERASGGKLTAADRHALPRKDFALPGGRYPIEDRSHGANALARVSQHGTPEEKARVREAVHRKYPDMGKS